MIYFIYFLAAFILLTLIFIIVVGKYVFDRIANTVNPFMKFGPKLIERAYRGFDFRYSFMYQKEENLRYNIFNPDVQVITDEEHKRYLIRDAARKMGEDMMDNGCIEIYEYDENFNPYHKRVTLKAKVYKPEDE